MLELQSKPDAESELESIPKLESNLKQKPEFEESIAERIKIQKKIWWKKSNYTKTKTPSQILSTIPITLAQLKAGNISEKLKNKIRQILFLSLKKIDKINP